MFSLKTKNEFTFVSIFFSKQKEGIRLFPWNSLDSDSITRQQQFGTIKENNVF